MKSDGYDEDTTIAVHRERENGEEVPLQISKRGGRKWRLNAEVSGADSVG